MASRGNPFSPWSPRCAPLGRQGLQAGQTPLHLTRRGMPLWGNTFLGSGGGLSEVMISPCLDAIALISGLDRFAFVADYVLEINYAVPPVDV